MLHGCGGRLGGRGDARREASVNHDNVTGYVCPCPQGPRPGRAPSGGRLVTAWPGPAWAWAGPGPAGGAARLAAGPGRREAREALAVAAHTVVFLSIGQQPTLAHVSFISRSGAGSYKAGAGSKPRSGRTHLRCNCGRGPGPARTRSTRTTHGRQRFPPSSLVGGVAPLARVRNGCR